MSNLENSSILKTLCPTCQGVGVIEKGLRFDYEALYDRYPKKGPGKKRGLKKLEKICTSRATYQAIYQAIENLRKENRERQFNPNFDTFINNYTDYLEVQTTRPIPPTVKAEPPCQKEPPSQRGKEYTQTILKMLRLKDISQ